MKYTVLVINQKQRPLARTTNSASYHYVNTLSVTGPGTISDLLSDSINSIFELLHYVFNLEWFHPY